MTAEAQVPPALFTFFEAMPRQGPGSDAATRALYARVRPLLPRQPIAADMGCGSGAAALVLAEDGAQVTGVDVHQPFLDALGRTAAERGSAELVATRLASMTDSGFPEDSLDLIWSEGAVYTVGFETALAAFKPLLRTGGVVVVSECTWLQEDVPSDLREYWRGGYPTMATVGGTIRRAEALGYRFLHAETLPAEVWEREFYRPMEALIERLGPKVSSETQEVILEQREEIELFRRYHAYFGYLFLAVQKPDGA